LRPEGLATLVPVSRATIGACWLPASCPAAEADPWDLLLASGRNLEAVNTRMPALGTWEARRRQPGIATANPARSAVLGKRIRKN
jgi:hypothetical protein